MKSVLEVELIITSDTMTVAEIEAKVGIPGHRSFQKGEEYRSKTTGTLNPRLHNLYAIGTGKYEQDDQLFDAVGARFTQLVLPVKASLELLKTNDAVEVVGWLWLETGEGGAGFDLSSELLSLLSTIANRVHVSVVQVVGSSYSAKNKKRITPS